MHVGSQARPQQRDDGAAAVVGVHTRAANLDCAIAQVLQSREVELLFRVEPSDALSNGTVQ
jgi:hypothetical protein